MTFLAKLW